MKKGWMVRAQGGKLVDLFTSRGIVAISWPEMGDLSQYKTKYELYNGILKLWPENSKATNNSIAGILYKFSRELKPEEFVITYEVAKRMYHIGCIKTSYLYRPDISKMWPNVLEVKWIDTILRDYLSARAKGALGSSLTLFSISSEVLEELIGKYHVTNDYKNG